MGAPPSAASLFLPPRVGSRYRLSMPTAPHFCGLILAAGQSSRMGTDKALLPGLPRNPAATDACAQTLLSAAILALRPLTRAVIVVAGRKRRISRSDRRCQRRIPRPQSKPRARPVQLVANWSPRTSRPRLQRGHDHAGRLPAPARRITRIASRMLRACPRRGLWAVAPENNGKHGHPLLVNRDLIDAFLAAPVTGNAREVLHA